MPTPRLTTVRAALRPGAALRRPLPVQRRLGAVDGMRLATTSKNREQQERDGIRDGIRDDGPAGEFNKGTNPNKTYLYGHSHLLPYSSPPPISPSRSCIYKRLEVETRVPVKRLTRNSYAGGAALLLGAVYWMFLGTPDKVGREAIKHDPMETGKERVNSRGR